MKHEIRVIDAIGNTHTLDLEVSHNTNGRLFASFIFDKGAGGHYVFGIEEIQRIMKAIIEEVI